MRRTLFWLAAVLLVAVVAIVAFYVAISRDADRPRRVKAKRLPPALNGQVTQETINDTICASGWTSKERRKAASWLQSKKRELLSRREGYGWPGAGAVFQLDHMVPIELGGAVEDDCNVALQWIGEAICKDGVEHCLAAKVCKGEIPLDVAQKAIADDWRAGQGDVLRSHQAVLTLA